MKTGKHYRIMGNTPNCTEEIDHADTEADARAVCKRYQNLFGPKVHVWVEVQTYVDGHLDEIYPLEDESSDCYDTLTMRGH